MRALLLLMALLLAGCPPVGECQVDDDCSGSQLCARNSECLPSSEVRATRTVWTIRGQTANATTCASTPDLYIVFGSFDPNDTYGYEPVPCAAGVFSVDKLPKRFTSVELGVVSRSTSEMAVFDSQGHAAVDLMP
jgi:hypothetical protein